MATVTDALGMKKQMQSIILFSAIFILRIFCLINLKRTFYCTWLYLYTHASQISEGLLFITVNMAFLSHFETNVNVLRTIEVESNFDGLFLYLT